MPRRRPSPLVVDVVIAAACFATGVLGASLDHRLSWPVVGLHALAAVPLVWRRRYPFLVTSVASVGTVWLSILGALSSLPAGQLVATYTFAALSPPLHRWILGAGTAIGVTLSILIPGDPPLAISLVGVLFAVAYTMGTATRARGDRIAMLEERARRLAESEAAAAARERERVAREVHDILAHSMSLVIVQAEAGPVVVRTDPDRAEQVFDTIAATARDALAQLRRTLGVLRDGGPERAPLPDLEALPALISSTALAGLRTNLSEYGRRRAIPADLAVTVYRVVQEALTNAVRHARATAATVSLNWDEAALNVVVSDDGQGLGSSPRAGGQGLVGMRERVAAAGGELLAGPGEGGVGFRVAARLPLR